MNISKIYPAVSRWLLTAAISFTTWLLSQFRALHDRALSAAVAAAERQADRACADYEATLGAIKALQKKEAETYDAYCVKCDIAAATAVAALEERANFGIS